MSVPAAVAAADAVYDAAKVVDNAHSIIKTADNVSDAASVVNKGWKVGDDITNLTRAGNVPSWSTVRQRYWKNIALNSPDLYPGQLDRLRRGLVPLDEFGIPYELHHPFGRAGDSFFDFEPVTHAEHWIIHYGK